MPVLRVGHCAVTQHIGAVLPGDIDFFAVFIDESRRRIHLFKQNIRHFGNYEGRILVILAARDIVSVSSFSRRERALREFVFQFRRKCGAFCEVFVSQCLVLHVRIRNISHDLPLDRLVGGFFGVNLCVEIVVDVDVRNFVERYLKVVYLLAVFVEQL